MDPYNDDDNSENGDAAGDLLHLPRRPDRAVRDIATPRRQEEADLEFLECGY